MVCPLFLCPEVQRLHRTFQNFSVRPPRPERVPPTERPPILSYRSPLPSNTPLPYSRKGFRNSAGLGNGDKVPCYLPPVPERAGGEPPGLYPSESTSEKRGPGIVAGALLALLAPVPLPSSSACPTLAHAEPHAPRTRHARRVARLRLTPSALGPAWATAVLPSTQGWMPYSPHQVFP